MKRFIALFGFIPLISAAVSNECFAFENPSKAQLFPYLNISINEIDTSLLVYNLHDVPHTNIPLNPTQQSIQEERNGFGVCSSKALDHGLCSEVGKFTLNINEGGNDEIVNKYVHKGETIIYEIQKSGLYCFIAYQESESVKGVKIDQVHTHGFLSIEKYQEKNSLFLSKALLDLSVVFIFALFFFHRKNFNLNIWESLPHSFIRDYTILASLRKTVPLFLLNYENTTGDNMSNFGALMFLPSQLFSYALFIKLFHSISCGKHSFSPITGEYSIFVVLFMGFSVIAGIVKSLYYDFKLKSVPFLSDWMALAVILEVGFWFYFIIWINSLNEKIEVSLSSTRPTISRKLNQSRAVIFASFVITKGIPILSFMLRSDKPSDIGNLNSRSDNMNDLSYQKAVIKITEYTLLRIVPWWKYVWYNIDQFSTPLITLSLLIIWRNTYSYRAINPAPTNDSTDDAEKGEIKLIELAN